MRPSRVNVFVALCAVFVGMGLSAHYLRSEPDNKPPDQAPREQEHLDPQGDPLPAAAVARLGTVRLRGQATAFAFARDGQTLASVGRGSTLRLWHIPSGREIGRLPGQHLDFDAVAFSDDGKTLAAIMNGGVIVVYDFSPTQPPALGKERLRLKPENGHPIFLAFLPDGKLLAGAGDGRVTLWDATGKEVRRFGTATERSAHVFSLSADGKQLAVANGRNDVVVWDAGNGIAQATLTGHYQVSSLALAPDGKAIAVGDATNTIRLWNIATRKTTARLVGEKALGQPSGHGDTINALVFTPDSKTLVSVGDYGDGTIRLWDVASGKERRQFKSQYGDGYRLALSPDGKTLAVAGSNNTIHLWDMTTGKKLDSALGPQGIVRSVAVAPNGKEAATGGSDGVIRFWDLATSKEVRSFRADLLQVHSLAYSPDGRQLASVSGAGEPARLWDVISGREVRSFTGEAGRFPSVSSLSYSPDGKKLALATHDSARPMNEPLIQLVDVATGKVERTVAQGLIHSLAFSPDSRLLAGGGMDCKVHLWDLTTGKEKWSATSLNALAAVAYSPDGCLVATGTYYDSDVIVFDAATGRKVRWLRSPSTTVLAVAISPDSRLLAASGDTPEVTLYELATGQLVQRLEGHTGAVWSLAFAPDGRSLVSGSFDTTALVWDLTGRPLAKKQRAPLTDAELESHWRVLANPESSEAYQVVLSLANAPKQAVAFLRTRLAEVKTPDAKVIAKWLAELDAEQFQVREAASHELARLGQTVETPLRQARAATTSAEACRRLDELLEKLASLKATEGLRWQRVVAILELAATPETRELLEHLARKTPSDGLRRQARGALKRLAKHE